MGGDESPQAQTHLGQKRTLGLSAEGIIVFKKLKETEQLMMQENLINSNPFTKEHEDRTNQLLDENLQVINIMRENLVTGKVNENVELMIRFRNNILLVLRMISLISGNGRKMAPLPIKLNTSFFPAASLGTSPQAYSFM
eukprot:TRINITY_DN1975_c0_g1_i1.p1 TRINITY_DN1975_c0_g1~~TRINITY_DN1975_c0_g1_i1.p1  ORF type:complete len:140 (-),score=29.18 TRINITY_DN1975_c0_g1_i1:98-517(-)